jgi:hypothetical protein
MPMSVPVGNGDIFHVAGFDLVHELREADVFFFDPLAGLNDGEKQHRQTNEYYPEDQSLYV